MKVTLTPEDFTKGIFVNGREIPAGTQIEVSEGESFSLNEETMTRKNQVLNTDFDLALLIKQHQRVEITNREHTIAVMKAVRERDELANLFVASPDMYAALELVLESKHLLSDPLVYNAVVEALMKAKGVKK